MSPLLNPPFRAEHIGSLLRPAVLLEKRKQFEANQCTAAELKAVEDAAIRDALKLQQDSNIGTITDGEFRRFFCSLWTCKRTIHLISLRLRGIFYEGVFEKLEGMKCIHNSRPL
jgi:hypothetical protein